MYTDLNLRLTDEQEELKDTLHRFAKEVLRPAGEALDKAGPEAVLSPGSPFWRARKKMREMGLHLTFIPERFGGAGMGPMEHHIVWEELGWGSVGLAISQDVDVYPAAWLLRMAPNNQRLIEEVIKPYVDDAEGRMIGCWGLTEPLHGSDMLMAGTPQFKDPSITQSLRARKEGHTWILNGQKSAWISNGPVATHALLFVGIDAAKGMSGGGICVAPLDLPGVSKGPVLKKLGQLDLPQGEVFFDEVRIPEEYMIVTPERYEFWVEQVLAVANCGMASLFTGVARSAFELALDYAKERIQGGRPIAGHQILQKKLFDMFLKVETARAYSRAVVEYCFTTIPAPLAYAVSAKVYATQAAFEVAHDALQTFGGYGLTKEYPIEKIFRDARASMLEDGSSEVLALIGAANILRSYFTM